MSVANRESASPPPAADASWARVERALRAALREVRFGSIEIVIHDSRIVQIERREKVRFPSDPERE